MQDKLIRLRAILSEMGSVAVAYSGGTDSAFILAVARDTLGDRALALTADSPSVPRAELEAARAVAAGLGVRARRPAHHGAGRSGLPGQHA